MCFRLYFGSLNSFKLIKTTKLISGNLASMSMYRENVGRSVGENMSGEAGVHNLAGMRCPYKETAEALSKESIDNQSGPLGLFNSWLNEACHTPGIGEPNAMCLATASGNGQPSSRMVLLKGFSENGFQFFTNYDSRKGQELEENPHGSLCFYWDPLKRSVRIEGEVEKLSRIESEDYFHSRPRASQIGASLYTQSQVISGRQVLTDKFAELTKEYEDENTIIPTPDNWGGYCLKPKTMEFWQGQTNRVHDRFRFRLVPATEMNEGDSHGDPEAKQWICERLAP